MTMDFRGLIVVLWSWGMTAALGLFGLIALVLAVRERKAMPELQGTTRWGKRMVLAWGFAFAIFAMPFVIDGSKTLLGRMDDTAQYWGSAVTLGVAYALYRVGRRA